VDQIVQFSQIQFGQHGLDLPGIGADVAVDELAAHFQFDQAGAG
jgi:hypothetical protein